MPQATSPRESRTTPPHPAPTTHTPAHTHTPDPSPDRPALVPTPTPERHRLPFTLATRPDTGGCWTEGGAGGKPPAFLYVNDRAR
jgi:hypothetical protein